MVNSWNADSITCSEWSWLGGTMEVDFWSFRFLFKIGGEGNNFWGIQCWEQFGPGGNRVRKLQKSTKANRANPKMQVVPHSHVVHSRFCSIYTVHIGRRKRRGGGGGGYNYKSEEAFKTCIYFISIKYGWKIQISQNKYWMLGEMALTLKAVTAPQTFQ